MKVNDNSLKLHGLKLYRDSVQVYGNSWDAFTPYNPEHQLIPIHGKRGARAVSLTLKAKCAVHSGHDNGYCQVDAKIHSSAHFDAVNHAVHIDCWGRPDGGENRIIRYASKLVELDRNYNFWLCVGYGNYGTLGAVELGIFMEGYWS